jgi:hypothetical protein
VGSGLEIGRRICYLKVEKVEEGKRKSLKNLFDFFDFAVNFLFKAYCFRGIVTLKKVHGAALGMAPGAMGVY